MTNILQQPKVFISYSWSSPGHYEMIRTYAERLVGDGVEVILDQWDLAEGQDKYAFMEKMVTDPTVTHVLVFSDSTYALKADERKAGVGTESQIMSKEVYQKVEQTKFIPLVCEKQENGDPCLPVFLLPRKWIDFSTPEKVAGNWEQLLRVLHGKPLHQKPELGKPPSYLLDTSGPSLPTVGKLSTLRDALANGRPTLTLCRRDFLHCAISFADSLRARGAVKDEQIEDKVLGDLRILLPLRDQIIDWLMIEAGQTETSRLGSIVVDLLERVLALKFRPSELNSWSDSWFDAHGIFAYELFLYVIAALIRNDRPEVIRIVFHTSYLLPDSKASRSREFATFSEFYMNSKVLARRKQRLKGRRLSPIADVIKERATRDDITFKDVMQAELLVFLAATLEPGQRWYPNTLVFLGSERFPLFVRAAQHSHFERLQIITGIESADDLRARFRAGCDRLGVGQWEMTFWADVSFWEAMRMDSLDTIK